MRLIEVLGAGCQKCQYVETIVREVVDAAGIEAEVRHVTDYAEIAARGVLSTPGLAIDGTVVVAGRIPTREQVAAWLDVTTAGGAALSARSGDR
jgi:small redox-active disulfide protein 2